MIDAAPEALHFDLNRVKLAIVRGRRKRKAVFVANKLRDFRERAIEFFLILGKVDAPAGGLRKLMKRLVGRRKALFHEGAIFSFLRRKFFVLRWFAEITGRRNG